MRAFLRTLKVLFDQKVVALLVGGLFYDNYPGGSGLMSGAVFGRAAGTAISRYLLSK